MPSRILVVEDDAFLGETICQSLQEHGAQTQWARDGEEAISFLDKAQPDLMLLDLVMPRKDGFAVLQYINQKNYAVPVVILSNLSSELSPDACRVLAAKDYILKSDIEEDELWSKISKYL